MRKFVEDCDILGDKVIYYIPTASYLALLFKKFVCQFSCLDELALLNMCCPKSRRNKGKIQSTPFIVPCPGPGGWEDYKKEGT